jgi:hypothetical protein
MPRYKWITNQAIIFIFGIFALFSGYRAYTKGNFVSHHYNIAINLGEYHYIYGLTLMIIGAGIIGAGIYTTIKLFKK